MAIHRPLSATPLSHRFPTTPPWLSLPPLRCGSVHFGNPSSLRTGELARVVKCLLSMKEGRELYSWILHFFLTQFYLFMDISFVSQYFSVEMALKLEISFPFEFVTNLSIQAFFKHLYYMCITVIYYILLCLALSGQ